MSRRTKTIAGCLVFLLAYVGTFSYWWLSSPVIIKQVDGRDIRIVEFQFNRVSYHAQFIWLPASWFMERVCGYREAGFAAMHEESIQRYAKSDGQQTGCRQRRDRVSVGIRASLARHA